MSEAETSSEDLVEFARSLSYGSRSDLSFKYFSRLDPATVGDNLARLLEEVGGLLDSGDAASLIDLTVALQAEAYGSRALNERYHYATGPFTRPERPLTELAAALLTSSGHFVAGDDPQPLGVDAMDQQEAEARISEFLREAPTLSELPVDADPQTIRVRHGGYDVRGVLRDHNVALPIDRMRELEASGAFASLHPTAYSFVGACAQGRLLKEVAPEWVQRIGAAGVDVVLLVPV